MLSRRISCFHELHVCFLFSMKEFAVIFHKQYDDTVLSGTSAVNKHHCWAKYIRPQVELRKTCGEYRSEARKIRAKRVNVKECRDHQRL